MSINVLSHSTSLLHQHGPNNVLPPIVFVFHFFTVDSQTGSQEVIILVAIGDHHIPAGLESIPERLVGIDLCIDCIPQVFLFVPSPCLSVETRQTRRSICGSSLADLLFKNSIAALIVAKDTPPSSTRHTEIRSNTWFRRP